MLPHRRRIAGEAKCPFCTGGPAMKRVMAVALAVLVLVATAAAQDEAPKSHKAAAEALLKTMDFDKQIATSVDQMVAMQIKANPKMAQFKGVMTKFLKKHMSYASLKGDLVKMYTEAFTEKELKDLTAFYKTPLGKKLLQKQPALMQKGAELGAKKVQDNAAELRKMIEDELKKEN
jgi:hypothetical protein